MSEQFLYQVEQQETSLIKEAFLYVRDMPFDPTNYGYRPKDVSDSINFVFRRRRGSCSAKHYLLGWLLETAGFQAEYITYPFYWQELVLPYPDELRNLLPHLPIQYHLALKVLTDGNERLLDVTWDPSLNSAGFPVNKLENITQDTILAVNPCAEPVVHLSAQKRWEYIETLKQTMPRNDVVVEFYKKMNQWLNTVRQQK